MLQLSAAVCIQHPHGHRSSLLGRGNPLLDSPVLAQKGHRPLSPWKRVLTLSSSYQLKKRGLKLPSSGTPLPSAWGLCLRHPCISEALHFREHFSTSSPSGGPKTWGAPPFTSGDAHISEHLHISVSTPFVLGQPIPQCAPHLHHRGPPHLSTPPHPR